MIGMKNSEFVVYLTPRHERVVHPAQVKILTMLRLVTSSNATRVFGHVLGFYCALFYRNVVVYY